MSSGVSRENVSQAIFIFLDVSGDTVHHEYQDRKTEGLSVAIQEHFAVELVQVQYFRIMLMKSFG